MPEPLRRSLTYDQGKEMAQHRVLSQDLNIGVYFCDPHSPWQKGTIENTNGLIRQYLKKGEDLSGYSQDELDHIAYELNTRPRKALGFLTPQEVYMKELSTYHRSASCCT